MRFPQADLGSQSTLEMIYPVGSIYASVSPTNPALLFRFGTWVEFGSGRVMVGRDAGQTEFDTLEETGGAKDVTLTTAQMPSHTHVQDPHNHTVTSQGASTGAQAGAIRDTSSNSPANDTNPTGSTTAVNQPTGGGQSHTNLQPYIVVNFWKRTA